ncbi:MAG TPA: S41 family peptidase, partial [Opitutus sp.]|nr:S41 family peptidase [Opitutus sp.]
TEWTEYSIELPLNPAAREVFFGFLVAENGRGWVDDLQLLVDGRPLRDAPKATRHDTAFDRDQEFTAGSRITLAELSPLQIQHLAVLCRVWGFLKYHHPKVTAGDYHWDFELFRVLPKALSASNHAALSTTLLEWVQQIGPPQAIPEVPQSEADVHLPADHRWLDHDATLSAPLRDTLKNIHAGRGRTASQVYVSFAPSVRNPAFNHEFDYRRIKLPDAGYQLLGLFRYWNIIRYWFPYRDLIEENWDDVLAEFIPRIGLAHDVDAYALHFMALITKVHDTHANLWSSLHLRPPVGDSQLPIAVRFVEGKMVVTHLLETAEEAPNPFMPGDLIRELNGVAIETLIENWKPFYAASNEPTRLRDIARSLTRGPAGPVNVRIERTHAMVDLTATHIPTSSLKPASQTHDLPGPTFRLLTPEVAYLKLSSVRSADIPDYVSQARSTKGWIIDLRNYPSEFVVFSLGSQLVGHPTDFARFTHGDLTAPGRFVFTSPIALSPHSPPLRPSALPASVINPRETTFADRPDFPNTSFKPDESTFQTGAAYTGKIVVLVDEVTQSQAEYTAMALRAAGALIVGSTTAGADGNVSNIPLPGGLRTMISGIGVFYPDKRPTQRIGIVPDIEVTPTPAGIRAGRDEILEAALRQVLGPDAPAAEIVRRAASR